MPAVVSDEPSINVHFGKATSQLTHHGSCGALELAVPVLAGRRIETMALLDGRIERIGNLLLLENKTHLIGAATVSAPERLEEPVQSVYSEVLSACAARGMHMHRAWNYVPDINASAHGLERYRQFNIGRWLAFEHAFGRDLRAFMPAASAVGMGSGQFAVFFIAGKKQPAYLENPSQVPAYHYPADYGPRPPSFARAVLVQEPHEVMGYLSGTASIEGHRSIGEGDWHTQFRTTMHNIQIMFERMGMTEALDGKAAEKAGVTVRDFRCYLRHPEALPLLQEWLDEAGLERDKVTFLQADICRAELDIEMEAIVTKRIG